MNLPTKNSVELTFLSKKIPESYTKKSLRLELQITIKEL